MKINEKKLTINCANLDPPEIRYIVSRLPFQLWELNAGLKYLGFYLKSNDYRKLDWLFLLEKLEKRIKIWSHGWLSRASRVVLIKLVLEAIPVYWMSMSWIPKGILERAIKLCVYTYGGVPKISRFCHGPMGKNIYPKSSGWLGP